MAEVNLKNVQYERSDYKSEEDGSHGSKIEQRVIQRDSNPKRSKSFKKRKTRKQCRTFSLSQSKNRSKKQSKKKRRGRSPSSSSSSYSYSYSLYRMKINLNGTSRLSFHLMQTHSLRNASQRKAFTTQYVK